MGLITRFNLDRIIKDFKTPNFFETGTFWGDGVAYATQSPFQSILSVEIVPEIAKKAAARFTQLPHVKIITDESAAAMEKELGSLAGNCVFWLDAHFPGADAGMTEYDADLDEEVRLPLTKEAEIISRLRKGKRDVIIMDDLRIYEDGPYENGNVPPDALPKMNRNIDFIYEYFSETHDIHKLYQEEGYIFLLPRPSKWSWAGLFGKKKEPADYLNEVARKEETGEISTVPPANPLKAI